MKQLTNKQYEEYQRFIKDKSAGRVLTRDAIELICRAYDNNPEQIGAHILASLASSPKMGSKT